MEYVKVFIPGFRRRQHRRNMKEKERKKKTLIKHYFQIHGDVFRVELTMAGSEEASQTPKS